MPVINPEEDILRKYLLGDYQQDPAALDRARERSERKELMGGLGSALNTISRATGAQNLSDEPYKQMAEGGQKVVSDEMSRQKMLRDYLKDKAGVALQSQSLEKQNKLLEETLRHNKALEGQKSAELSLEAKKAGTGTPDERKAATFVSEMESANKDLSKSRSGGYKREEDILASAPEPLKKTAGYFGVTNPKMSVNDQAERRFINATLRRESGANISPTEYESAVQQYFPRPGDSPEAIAQKERNRQEKIQAMSKEAGPLSVSQSRMIKIRNPETGETRMVTEEEAKSLGAM